MTGLVDWLKLRERSREVPSKVSLHDCSAHVNNVYTKIPVAADADGQYQFADPCPQSMKTVSTGYQVILIRQLTLLQLYINFVCLILNATCKTIGRSYHIQTIFYE